LLEDIRLMLDHLEAQAFFAPALHVDGFNLAALDTLSHSLPGNRQQTHHLIYGYITHGSFFGDARTQVRMRQEASEWVARWR
jgi:hypothetical protein